MGEIDELIARLRKFRDERGWRKYHTLKNLAISISIEAAELLENFQWVDGGGKEVLESKKEAIEDEVADIFIYLLFFCDAAGIDLLKVTHRKMDKNEVKYSLDRKWRF